MKTLKILSTILIAFITCGSIQAENKSGKAFLIEKYKKQLTATTNAVDSVRRLYSLFDLSDRQGQLQYAWQLYETAGRARDLPAQMDMLKNLAVFYQSNDSVIDHLMNLADKITNEEAKSATKTFIFNQRLNRKRRMPSDKYIQTILLDSITKSHDLKGQDIYDRISLLYQIIQYLGVDADGVLFNECLNRYAELIEALPASDYALKNQFYTTAAMIHSRLNGNPAKAIRYDRQLLQIIEQLQQMYKRKNRKFRNYDTNKFISYRRMLSNYEALSKDEIETIYDSIQALYNRDSDVKKTVDKNGQAYVFYYMATKDYEKAIPALRGFLQNNDLSPYQRQKYNSMLMEASKAINDKESYHTSMEYFIKYSREIDSLRKITMKRETLLRDSLFNTPLFYDDSITEGHMYETEGSAEKTLLILSAVLAVLLIVYATLYLKLRMRKYKS